MDTVTGDLQVAAREPDPVHGTAIQLAASSKGARHRPPVGYRGLYRLSKPVVVGLVTARECR